MASVRSILLVPLVALALALRTYGCPQPILTVCKCVSTPSGFRIECVDQPLDAIARGIGSGAKIEKLSIRNTNGVTEVPAQAFGSTQIRELEFTGNSVLRVSKRLASLIRTYPATYGLITDQ